MTEDPMAKKKLRAKKRRHVRRDIQIGDRVRYVIGTSVREADVIGDYGNIGVGGRRLIFIECIDEAGDHVQSTIPAEIAKRVPARRKNRRWPWIR